MSALLVEVDGTVVHIDWDSIYYRAIAESLGLAFTPSEPFLTSDDPDLEQAIRLSQEESEAWQHRQEEEEETLKRILELSLVEK